MILADRPPGKKPRALPARRNSRNSSTSGEREKKPRVTEDPLLGLRGRVREGACPPPQSKRWGHLPDPPPQAGEREIAAPPGATSPPRRSVPDIKAGSRSAPDRAPPDPSDLLSWFDGHRRALPWRAGPGETADAYRVWLSEIMLQQTTVKTVGPYFSRFLERFPSVTELAAADIEDVLRLWAGLGYYARARNLHSCARAIAARGSFPDTEEELLTLPGIGAYTAAAIAAIAFDRPATPVDGNV